MFGFVEFNKNFDPVQPTRDSERRVCQTRESNDEESSKPVFRNDESAGSLTSTSIPDDFGAFASVRAWQYTLMGWPYETQKLPTKFLRSVLRVARWPTA